MGLHLMPQCKQFEPIPLPWLGRSFYSNSVETITMHESQVQTLEKAVIDLNDREARTSLMFVYISRARSDSRVDGFR